MRGRLLRGACLEEQNPQELNCHSGQKVLYYVCHEQKTLSQNIKIRWMEASPLRAIPYLG